MSTKTDVIKITKPQKKMVASCINVQNVDEYRERYYEQPNYTYIAGVSRCA